MHQEGGKVSVETVISSNELPLAICCLIRTFYSLECAGAIHADQFFLNVVSGYVVSAKPIQDSFYFSLQGGADLE